MAPVHSIWRNERMWIGELDRYVRILILCCLAVRPALIVISLQWSRVPVVQVSKIAVMLVMRQVF